MRGVGEPIWAERSPAELVECERHEALLNVAFADPSFWLLCRYDTGALAPDVIEEAQRNHPHLTAAGAAADSTRFPGNEALRAPFDRLLPEPPADAVTVVVDRTTLRQIRAVVAGFAYAAGMAEGDVSDLVLTVNELAGNSIRHAGGDGTLRLWREDEAVIAEVSDRGRIEDPLAGRVEPPLLTLGGRGLWMANQLCELVQIRSFADGGAVRVHKRVR
jgi:anti-sigma regulatory factor (Ser/Thr protein kinase)